MTTLLATMMLLATGFIFSACSTDDPIPTPNTAPDSEISLNADVWQVMEGTRATTFDNASRLQAEASFTCAIYNENTPDQFLSYTTVVWSGSQWLWNDGKHYWPTSGNLDFFAYMPASANNPGYVSVTYAIVGGEYGDEPRPYFNCTNLPISLTPTDATKEFIWALTRGQNRTDNASGVTMNFKHPFARIKFKLSAASGTNVTVNRITIPGVNRNGHCILSGTGSTATSTWESLTNSGNLVISGTPATNDDAVYLVIPNNYGTKTLTVNATWSDWGTATKDVSANVNFNWEVGNSYTYSLTLSKEALIVNEEKYTEQW